MWIRFYNILKIILILKQFKCYLKPVFLQIRFKKSFVDLDWIIIIISRGCFFQRNGPELKERAQAF